MTSQPRRGSSAARPGLSATTEPVSARPRHVRLIDGEGSRGGPRHNLPLLPSSFVGRNQEVADVASLLSSSRLVTLTGPGGMGKTRLAIQVAFEVAPLCPDGVWLVELAPLSDPDHLPEAIAARAGLTGPTMQAVGGGTAPVQHAGPWSTDDLAFHIDERSVLLVLDNCEHMVDACGHLVDVLLRSCAGLRVLATSREPLGIVGEHRWSLGPLSLPDVPVDVAAVEASEAGQLFLERAAATSPEFRLTEEAAPSIAEICRRLDGMPLAIELAAARLASMSLADIQERLDDRFRLLTTGGRTVMARHQTLGAALEWSHEQLSPAEATLLRRVSVFSGWPLPAAEEVCSGDEVDRAEVVDLLATLVNKSLVVVETHGERARYRLLETVREWARTKLGEASELETLSRRHALWFLALAERADDELAGNERQRWLNRLDAEHDNLRAALEWSRSADPQLGVRLATALATFWDTRGHLQEGIGWLEWAVTASEESPAALRATLLRKTGLIRGMLGDITSALAILDESSALFAEAGDHDSSLCACNSMFHMFRSPRQSVPGLIADVDRCRTTGDSNKLAHFLWALGQAHFLLGELDEARRLFQECLDIGGTDTDGDARLSGLLGLGRVATILGEHAAAEAALNEARAHAEELGDVDGTGTALSLLGDLARHRGELALARHLLDEAMEHAREDGTPVAMARTVYFRARLAKAESVSGDNGAGELFTEALTLARGADVLGFHDARCLLGLGWAALANGDRSAAAGRLLEALATAQAIDDAQATARALERLSGVARLDGRLEEADNLARRGLELHHKIGDVAGIAASLDSVAGLAVDSERWEVAARLLAAAETILYSVGYVRNRLDQARQEREVEQVRSAMGDEEFSLAWAEGAALSADEAVAYALRGRGSRDRPATGWESLTPAEREVVRLVAEGLTNPEVARRLFVSPRTVGHHLAHVYRKLGINNRGALIKEVAGRDPDAA